MNRRQFIGFSGAAAATIFMGGILNPANLLSAGRTETSSAAKGRRDRIRMNGARCHDHRFLNESPNLSFEREIFGI